MRKLFVFLALLYLSSCTIAGTGIRDVRSNGAIEGVQIFTGDFSRELRRSVQDRRFRRVCAIQNSVATLPDIPFRTRTLKNVAAAAKDAVINIYVKTTTPVGAHLLGIPVPLIPTIPIPGRALGSGFICSPDGFVLSNAHVVKSATELYARGANGKVMELELIALDESKDLSLLKIKGEGLYPFMTLAPAKRLAPGDFVLALGNPLGLNHSVSHGIVSQNGLHEAEPVPGFDQEVEEAVSGFLLSDTPLNPGNSGGPLVDLSGKAVAVNTAIAQNAQGISLSVPTEMVEEFLAEVVGS